MSKQEADGVAETLGLLVTKPFGWGVRHIPPYVQHAGWQPSRREPDEYDTGTALVEFEYEPADKKHPIYGINIRAYSPETSAEELRTALTARLGEPSVDYSEGWDLPDGSVVEIFPQSGDRPAVRVENDEIRS